MQNALLGTSEYLPDLINRAREKSSSVDAVLLESLLMAMIAGPRHLCIRTNTGSIIETSHTVGKLLSVVLGYHAHIVHIDDHLKPTSMLSRCFLKEPSNLPQTGQTQAGKAPSSITPTYTSHIDSHGHTASSHGIDYTSDATSHDYAVLDDTMTLASSRRPLLDRPAPADMTRMASTQSKAIGNLPPQCVVITGLERAGLPAQRALWQALVDERVELDEDMYKMEAEQMGEVGIWPLQKDFLMIYICESDQWERPRIHKGLIDAFAFSAEFHPPKHARTWSKSRTDSVGPRSASALSASGQQSTITGSTPVITPSEISTLRALCMEPSPFDTSAKRRPRVYIQPHLGMYATDLLSMARHAAELDGTLLTRRAHDDLAAFARARRVIRGDNSGAVLIRAALEEVKAVMREATSMTSDPASGMDEGPFGGGTVRESGDWLHVGAKSMLSGDDVSSMHEPLSDRGEVWEVSDEEIRAAFPVVVRHRVRVKDSLEDGITGAMYLPMRGQMENGKSKEVRRSVEDILQDILEDRDVSFIS